MSYGYDAASNLTSLTDELNRTTNYTSSGRTIPVPMTDPRWPASDGWVKRSQNVNGDEYSVKAIWGYSELVDHDNHYIALQERDKAALKIFLDMKSEFKLILSLQEKFPTILLHFLMGLMSCLPILLG